MNYYISMSSRDLQFNKERHDSIIRDIFRSAKYCRPGTGIIVHLNDIDEFFMKINKNGDIISLSNKRVYSSIREKVNGNLKLSPFLEDIIFNINEAREALNKAGVIQKYFLRDIAKKESDYALFHFIHKKNRKYWELKDTRLFDLVTNINVLRNTNRQMWDEFNKLRDDVFEIHGTSDLSEIIFSKRKAETKTKAIAVKEERIKAREQVNVLMKQYDEQYKDNECWQAMKKSERKKYLLYGSYPVSTDIHLRFRQHVSLVTMSLYYFRRKENVELGEWTLSPEMRPLYTHDNRAFDAYIRRGMFDDNPTKKRKRLLYIHIADYFILERKNEIVYKCPGEPLKKLVKKLLPAGLIWKGHVISALNSDEIYFYNPFGHHIEQVCEAALLFNTEFNWLTAEQLFQIRNTEIMRRVRDKIGIGKFLWLLKAAIIDENIDEQSLPMKLYEAYNPCIKKSIQILEVVCPSTKRVYHLYPPNQRSKNVWEAKASTFNNQPIAYRHGDVGLVKSGETFNKPIKET